VGAPAWVVATARQADTLPDAKFRPAQVLPRGKGKMAFNSQGRHVRKSVENFLKSTAAGDGSDGN
jgi:hypothetical protein